MYNGLSKDLQDELIDLLEDCAEYFANREDADYDYEAHRYIPSKEMKLRQRIIQVELNLAKEGVRPNV